MDPLRDSLDGLSPSRYVATLSEIAHVDGFHPAERDLLDQHAALTNPVRPTGAQPRGDGIWDGAADVDARHAYPSWKDNLEGSDRPDRCDEERLPEAGDNHDMRFLKPDGLGYPGTLVAFELPVESVGSYDDLIETIQKRARERTPRRAQHHWIRYEESPSEAVVFVVRYASENTERAERLAREQLEPRILRKEPIVLDFGGMDIATQSYLHALLFSALRLAWARQSFIYVVNASSPVRSGIELVEDYALGG